MQASFKVIPEGKTLNLDIDIVNRSLPCSMRVEERGDGVHIVVETPVEEDGGLPAGLGPQD